MPNPRPSETTDKSVAVTTPSKLLVCKIKILLPVVQGEIVFACTYVVSNGFANRMIKNFTPFLS